MSLGHPQQPTQTSPQTRTVNKRCLHHGLWLLAQGACNAEKFFLESEEREAGLWKVGKGLPLTEKWGAAMAGS